MSFNNEMWANNRQPRWIDRLSTNEYLVFSCLIVATPFITSYGISRTLKAWHQHRDSELRIQAGKLFLKNIAAYNHKFYPYLLPKVKIGAPIPMNVHGEEKVMFPNLADFRSVGKGITQYNWRNGDIGSVQRSLKRIDAMTPQELYTFTTLYTLLSNQKGAFELVDTIMRWVLKGEVNIDDIRAANVPEFAKYDLPPEELEIYEKEGWSSFVLHPDSAAEFVQRYQDAEAEYRKRGGKGLFSFNKPGAYTETLSQDEIQGLQDAKAQQKEH